MRTVLSALALVAVGSAPALAEEAAPLDCPAGARSAGPAGAAYCAPTVCINDGSCPAGEGYSCERDVGLCVVSQRVACPDDPTNPDCTVAADVALGSCSRPGDCATGDCRIMLRCVKASVNLLWLFVLVGGTLLAVIVFFVVNRRRTRPSV